jgi:hypothetical protein
MVRDVPAQAGLAPRPFVPFENLANGTVTVVVPHSRYGDALFGHVFVICAYEKVQIFLVIICYYGEVSVAAHEIFVGGLKVVRAVWRLEHYSQVAPIQAVVLPVSSGGSLWYHMYSLPSPALWVASIQRPPMVQPASLSNFTLCEGRLR